MQDARAAGDLCWPRRVCRPGPKCCEVEHLIPLELGGSNNLKKLGWNHTGPCRQPPRTTSLKMRFMPVCSGSMTLADAQRCIASNWVKCWEKHVVPGYDEQWASEHRQGWQ